MKRGYTVKKSIVIDARASKVWQALTRPEMVKQYLYGTELSADWRIGGALIYRGQWQGKSYEDKGKVLAFKPEKLLKTTFLRRAGDPDPAAGQQPHPGVGRTLGQELGRGP